MCYLFRRIAISELPCSHYSRMACGLCCSWRGGFSSCPLHPPCWCLSTPNPGSLAGLIRERILYTEPYHEPPRHWSSAAPLEEGPSERPPGEWSAKLEQKGARDIRYPQNPAFQARKKNRLIPSLHPVCHCSLANITPCGLSIFRVNKPKSLPWQLVPSLSCSSATSASL